MKHLLAGTLACLLLAPLAALAASPFDGTWKAEPSAAKPPDQPEVFSLKDGSYHCETCTVAYTVKADGTDQKVVGSPYYDTVAVKVVDARTIEVTAKKAGKPTLARKSVVSADGKTATSEWTDSTGTSPVANRSEYVRVGVAPVGAHAISGTWRATKVETLTDSGLLFTLKLEGDVLKMSNPTGQSYAAKIDGSDAPFKGDPGTTSVSIKRIDERTFEETDKRDGKVIGIGRSTVSADGKTMTSVFTDVAHGNSKSEWVAHKK